MLVPFDSALTSRQLFVNPALVRSVVDGVQMGQVKHSSRCDGGSSSFSSAGLTPGADNTCSVTYRTRRQLR
jgi:hypothetical protein